MVFCGACFVWASLMEGNIENKTQMFGGACGEHGSAKCKSTSNQVGGACTSGPGLLCTNSGGVKCAANSSSGTECSVIGGQLSCVGKRLSCTSGKWKEDGAANALACGNNFWSRTSVTNAGHGRCGNPPQS